MGDDWDHPLLSRHEYEQKLAGFALDALGEDEHWFYLSFANDERFLGGVYVKAPTAETAWMVTGPLKLNPGGQVMIYGPLTDNEVETNVPKANRWRLLTAEEVDA